MLGAIVDLDVLGKCWEQEDDFATDGGGGYKLRLRAVATHNAYLLSTTAAAPNKTERSPLAFVMLV